jgi:hypothetical protein
MREEARDFDTDPLLTYLNGCATPRGRNESDSPKIFQIDLQHNELLGSVVETFKSYIFNNIKARVGSDP